MKTSVFKSDQFQLTYLKQGSGEKRLIFIHGVCGSKDVWSHQINSFHASHEVIALDCLGHGESSAVAAASFMHQTTTSIRNLLTHLPPKPTTLVGHSLGGIILNELITPEAQQTSYVFVDSPCLHSAKRLAQYNDWELEILNSVDQTAMIADWFGSFATEACSPENRRLIVDEALKFSPQWLASMMREMPAPEAKETGAPILIVEGQQSFPRGNDLSWIELYPQSEVWRYTGAGHFYFLEDPEPFNRRLLEFVVQ